MADAPGGLQFDKAEPAGPAKAAACVTCEAPLADVYHLLQGQKICSGCRTAIETRKPDGTPAGRFVAALGLGLAAAAGGAVIYFAVLKLTGYEIGLIAILVGFLVGTAVNRGSQGKGGWLYQDMAVLLTYCAIVTTYMPFVIEGLRQAAQEEGAASPAAAAAPAGGLPGLGLGLLIIFAIAFVAPFLAGVQNFMGWLIIGFALFQAWKMNQRSSAVVTGPFRITGG